MRANSDKARFRRIKVWILLIMVSLALSFLIFQKTLYAFGVVAGGFLIIMNLLGTERAVRSFFTGGVLGKAAYAIGYLGKLALTAAIIAVVLKKNLASPLGLVLGLLILPVALVFDFLVFPGDREAEEEN
ncbi:MAG: ATP synthase subunit I [bacterium]